MNKVLRKLFFLSISLICVSDVYIQGHECVTVAAHGLGARKEHAWGYHIDSGLDNAFIEGPLHSFNFADVDNIGSSCIGQEADIALLHEAVQQFEECELFGWSRGAVTIANYLGSYVAIKKVPVVRLESPFADIKDVVKHKVRYAFFTRFVSWFYPNHDPNGIQPIKVAHKVNKEIPIFIYCSKEDALIPAQSSIAYYEELRKSGHNKVHILVVDHGAHANIINGKDGHIVRNVTHAFKRAYGRPHNPKWADLGQARFEQCQPSVIR